MNLERLSTHARRLSAYLLTRGPRTGGQIKADLDIHPAGAEAALSELGLAGYRCAGETQADGGRLYFIENAVEVSPSSYVLQRAEKSYCPHCRQQAHLLTPKEPAAETPTFFVCFPCASIFQAGEGPVPLDAPRAAAGAAK